MKNKNPLPEAAKEVIIYMRYHKAKPSLEEPVYATYPEIS